MVDDLDALLACLRDLYVPQYQASFRSPGLRHPAPVAARDLLRSPRNIGWATLFHDAIYDARSKNPQNEICLQSR